MLYLSYMRRLEPRRIIMRVLNIEALSDRVGLYTVNRVDPPGELIYRIAVLGDDPLPVISSGRPFLDHRMSHRVHTLLVGDDGTLQVSTLPCGDQVKLFEVNGTKLGSSGASDRGYGTPLRLEL